MLKNLKKYLVLALLFIIGGTTLKVVPQEAPSYKVGFLIVATGKYTIFVEPLITSARTHFCKRHKVTFFVFTDGVIPVADDIVRVEQNRLGWPYDTLLRFDMYYKNRELLKSMDYLFACDADARFVADVGDEILSDRVATQHPGFVGKRGSYEMRSISRAYVAPHEGNYYFAGGFYGGKTSEFLSMMEVVLDQIRDDANKNFIAVWHDESHLNRYFIDHKPTKILTPSYCYPESWNLPYPKKLLVLDKNHKEFQQ